VMADAIKDGGPAFPDRYNDGMTLRDYFAGQALAGIAADASATDVMTYQKLSEWSYAIADAMLSAREAEAK